MKVDNAVILAAGTSSRFAPLSYETHKALVEVKGEVLIERQIRQLQEAQVPEIYIVTGYKAEQFSYLQDKFQVQLIHNPDYQIRNNHSSIYAAKDILKNSYVCSSDNYFAENPFEAEVEESYYAAVYANGPTTEWCLSEDEEGYISGVTIGGANSWYMLGHTFFAASFSRLLLTFLEDVYDREETYDKLWESVYLDHLDVLKMKVRKYGEGIIFEFDTLDELRQFDQSYVEDTRSRILKKAAAELGIRERDICRVSALKNAKQETIGCLFDTPKGEFRYLYGKSLL